MEGHASFRQFLNKFVDLSEDEYGQYVLPYVEQRQFRKKQLVSRIGEVENYVNFIVQGLVRKYFVHQGEEIILMLCSEGHVFNDLESFYNRTPGQYCIDTLEPTTLYSISHDNLERIFQSAHKLERAGRRVVTFAMVLKDRWQLQMAQLSPRERFLHLVRKRPELLQRVPQKHLASFLNIQPETFSRFKHLLRERSDYSK